MDFFDHLLFDISMPKRLLRNAYTCSVDTGYLFASRSHKKRHGDLMVIALAGRDKLLNKCSFYLSLMRHGTLNLSKFIYDVKAYLIRAEVYFIRGDGVFISVHDQGAIQQHKRNNQNMGLKDYSPFLNSSR